MPQSDITTLTYNVTGNREDLLDLVVNVDAKETPIWSRLAKVKATSTNHEWQQDSLATPSTAGYVEGVSATFAAASARTRLGNYTQIFRRTVTVSDTQRAMNPAGIGDEYEYQLQKQIVNLARDIEITLIRGGGSASSSGASAGARLLRGMNSWISSNTGGPAAANSALAESEFTTLLEAIYNNSGNPNMVFVTSRMKRDISGFSGGASKQIAIGEDDVKLNAAVDVYMSDFGLVGIILDRWCLPDTGLVLEVDKWRVAMLRPIEYKNIAYLGGSTDGKVEAELTLEALHEKTAGRLVNVSS